MNQTAFALAIGLLALGGASAAPAAYADSFTPAGGVSTFSGMVTLTGGGGLTVTCNATITIAALGSTDAEVSAATLSGGGLCGLFPPGPFPWNIDVYAPVPPPIGQTATQLRIWNVQIGPCGPAPVIVNWSTSGPAISFPAGATIGPCPISGTLTQSGSPPLVITN